MRVPPAPLAFRRRSPTGSGSASSALADRPARSRSCSAISWTGGNRYLTSALSGITAAVVGVILNLAMVFGIAVLLPAGLGQAPDWFALTLTVAAFVALFLLEVEAIWVILAGASVGLLHAWLK
jgi:chromate transport protein ChrA